MGVTKVAVDMQGAEQIVGGDLPVDDLMQLLAVYRMVEADAVLRPKPGHHRERRLLFPAGFACAAVGAQLVDLAAEGDQLAVEFVKGSETEVAVGKQIGDGGIALIDAAQERAHQRGLIEHVIRLLGGKPAYGFTQALLGRYMQKNGSSETSSLNKYKKD
ncbi:Uncharacterised protein [Raoultella planticola]|uniref:Uncharacterized protein n=1 Tax=Raoultella planticola TaxID=575 RepID=A0A485AGW6_RAOPL|nr:Uncharacterised protein [Raoultella planticola]